MDKPSRPWLSLIVAMSDNRVIGRDGGLPWRLASDLRRFKQLTMGHHLIMGRKTFDAIGRLLPGRTTIVVTRDTTYVAPGAIVVHSLRDALLAAAGDDEPFIVGGGEIYREALSVTDRIYLTRVHAHIEGDTLFPEIPTKDWRVVREEHLPAIDDQLAHTFQVLERRS